MHIHVYIHTCMNIYICFKHFHEEVHLPDIYVPSSKHMEPLLSDIIRIIFIKPQLAIKPQPAEDLLLINLSARQEWKSIYLFLLYKDALIQQ